MKYMSLYNLERPRTLSQVRGEEKVIAQIRAIIASGNVPNVCLFVGPRGTGKTTVARIFSRALNCEHPTDDGPCNECDSCISIARDSSMDVIEIDAASNNKVEDVHGIIEGSKYSSLSKYKIYIIDEVHMLSTAAFNALLKLFEEPPQNVLFILCTTEEHKVPVTIISRCRRFYFEKISLEVIEDYLAELCQKYNTPYETDALRLIAKASEGCMRDALSLLDVFIDAGNANVELAQQILGVARDEAVFDILTNIEQGNCATVVTQLRNHTKRGSSLQNLTKAFIGALSDTAFFIQSKDLSLINGTEYYRSAVEAYSKVVSTDRVFDLLQTFSEIYQSVQKSGEFILEAKLISAIGYQSQLSEAKREIAELKERVEMLEEALFSGVTIESAHSKQIHEMVEDISDHEGCEPEQREAKEQVRYMETEGDSFDEPPQPDNSANTESDEIRATVYDMDILPGDIAIPQGTEVAGTITLFGSSESEEPATESAENNQSNTSSEDLFSVNDMFSAFARQR